MNKSSSQRGVRTKLSSTFSSKYLILGHATVAATAFFYGNIDFYKKYSPFVSLVLALIHKAVNRRNQNVLCFCYNKNVQNVSSFWCRLLYHRRYCIMKNKLLILVSLILILALSIPAFAASVVTANNGGTLRLRKGAGTNYATVAIVTDGDNLTVLSKGSVWTKVETDGGDVGYLKNLYIAGLGSLYADGTTYYSGRYTGYVKTKHSGSKVNLRSGASASTSSIGKIANGKKVAVLGENGSFYLVEINGTQGFISKSYVSKSSSSSSSNTTTTATVTASALNMRKSASVNSSIVTTLSKGTKVTVLSKGSSGWWKVKYGSKTGYMASKYLKK